MNIKTLFLRSHFINYIYKSACAAMVLVLCFFAPIPQAHASTFEAEVLFMPREVRAGGRTLLYFNLNNFASEPATLTNDVVINLPAGVTGVVGGASGFNENNGACITPSTITVATNTITIGSGLVAGTTTSGRGVHCFAYAEVEVSAGATVTLPANSAQVNYPTLVSASNIVADESPVIVDFTTNPKVTESCSAKVGFLLDDSGSMSVSERQSVIEGISGMVDDLIRSGSAQIGIADFSSAGTGRIALDMTTINAANRTN